MKEAVEAGREYALCGFFTGFFCPSVSSHRRRRPQPDREMMNMPKFMNIVLGGQDLVAQVDEQRVAIVSGAGEQVAQRVGAAAPRSMK